MNTKGSVEGHLGRFGGQKGKGEMQLSYNLKKRMDNLTIMRLRKKCCFLKNVVSWAEMAHIFNTSTQEAQAGKSLS